MNIRLARLERIFRQVVLRQKDAKGKYVNRVLNIYGPQLLAKFHEVAEKHGKQYWICFGSLLGFYREHGFIGHDNDLDVGMFEEDITIDFIEALISEGFSVKHTLVTHKMNGFEVTLTYKGVDIDIFSFRKDEEKGLMIGCVGLLYKGDRDLTLKWGKYAVKRVGLPNRGFEIVNFVGVDCWAPKNQEEILRILYGENFMTPIKGYKCKPDGVYIFKEPEEENWSYFYTYGWFIEQKEKGLL